MADAIGHGIAYATEDRKRYGLNLIEDIKRNVSAARLSKLAHRGWVDDHEEYRVAEGFRRSLNIKAPTVASITGKLSGGNQQKVVLSKWIFTDPDVLILDEPTRGIDVGAKYEIYTIINRLADEGKAILVISSELPELLGICDRIYALSAGRITGEVTRADATQERLMQFMTHVTESRMTSTAPAPGHRGARGRRHAEVAAAAVVQPAPERHLRRVRTDRGAVLGAHERRAAGAAEHLQHRRPELLHPDPRHRDDPDHHRRAHRPVRGLGRGGHRGDLGRADGEPARAVAAGGARRRWARAR